MTILPKRVANAGRVGQEAHLQEQPTCELGSLRLRYHSDLQAGRTHTAHRRKLHAPV
jgi:hypothetical protein